MSTNGELFNAENATKANFDDIYNAPDPRAYYTTLDALDYQIPTNAKSVFQKILQRMERGRHTKIVDIGCSYGVNAAMLRFDTTFHAMARRYFADDIRRQSTAETILQDAAAFAPRLPESDITFVGLDVAREAVGYADAVGLVDETVVANLEEAPPSEAQAATLCDADLVITTGAVGYVGAETFAHIINAADAPVWIAAFVLRQFPFAEIADRLDQYGLVTEKLEARTFLQRRFCDSEEQAKAIEAVSAAGCDPGGFESEGYYHAELYLARPAGEISAPVSALDLV